ncbi:MAG: 50S ribosomal protein L10 [Promethearchaeota archaeon]|nr:MAG: 50S ribosomal protein L10 [Candidatus Lokiarchaeota archaeon]
MISKKDIPKWKLDEIEYLVDLFKKYKNIAVIMVGSINDKQIQDTRKILRGKAEIRMSKKSIQIRAIEKYKKESKKTNLDDLAKNIPGQSSLVFTDMNLFDLKKIFNESEWMVPAKPDEITPVDIWVPAGDTGLPTGQVISELNMTLRLPTRIQNDTIWIREKTRTHKAGEIVDVKQAAVLKKLGIKPIESLIKIHYAWSEGEIIPEDILYMDIESFQRDVASCYLAALAILFELPIFLEEMTDEYIKKAVFDAKIINTIIFEGGIKASLKKEEAKPEEEKPDEEEEEEESAPGIGGLFG